MGSDQTADRFERMFYKLFDLLKDSGKGIQGLSHDVGKLRAAVNEFMQYIRSRPCIIDENIQAAEELAEKCNSCALTRLDSTNKRLMEIIFWGFVMIFMGITGTLAGLGIYVAQHEEVIMKFLTIWGGVK